MAIKSNADRIAHARKHILHLQRQIDETILLGTSSLNNDALAKLFQQIDLWRVLVLQWRQAENFDWADNTGTAAPPSATQSGC